ncbi:MAG: hypothetical protein Ct9H300mP25_14230 [Acidobacteriota bacterium]|nr:MAG: hypothetical protein Ct9H300mP25_14230 [Acidobacteriota bacterium]
MSKNRVVAVVEWFAQVPVPQDENREALMFDAVGQLAAVFEREETTEDTYTDEVTGWAAGSDQSCDA